ERESVERPRLRRPPEAVNRARRVVVRRACAQQRPRVTAKLVRDGQAQRRLAEEGDEPVVRGIHRVRPLLSLRRAAEPLEQPELREAAVAVDGEAAELRQDPLARRLRDEAGVLADERLRAGLEPEAELVLEPDGAEAP